MTRHEDAWRAAAERVSFQLNYSRAPEAREFRPGHMAGPMIDDAFGGEHPVSGEWAQNPPPAWYIPESPEMTQADWIAHFAHMALNEAVHEALEWFQVDGRPWLNPHGEHENAIYAATDQLAAALAALVSGGES